MVAKRQYACVREIARQNKDWGVLVLCPKKWVTGEEADEFVEDNFRIKGLQMGYAPTLPVSMYNFVLREIENEVKEFKPDLIFHSGEPGTLFNEQIAGISKLSGIPYGCFTWENRVNLKFQDPFDSFEKNSIASAKFVMCGTEDARDRMLNSGVIGVKDKLVVCPHHGIDTNMYSPNSDVEKEYDFGYIGRFTECKGVRTIEKIVEKLGASMLWVGGRGDYTPSYGDIVEWKSYDDISDFYNKIKVMITLPYNYESYSEQFASSIAESLACGTPVIHTNNGSLEDVYGSAPTIIIPEDLIAGDKIDKIYEIVKAYKTIIDSEDPEKLICSNRQWILDNLSNDKIAQKHAEIFERMIGGESSSLKSCGRILPEGFKSKEEYLLYLRHLFPYDFAKDKLQKSSFVLDVGCGEGYGTDLLSKYVSRIIGIDVDRNIIKHASDKYKSKNCSFKTYDGIKIPYKDNTFNAVVSFQVVEHISDDAGYISEVYRVLKKNGIFIVTTPNRTYRLMPNQRPWNTSHIREYHHSGFEKLLKNKFSDVNVWGIRGNEEVQRIEIRRVRGILSGTPKRIEKDTDFTKKYKITDYHITEKHVDDNLDLIGICKK